MKNEFQKLVDRELSGLCWNERMRQRVLHSLEKEDKPVKKKMTVAMALTFVMVLVGSLALAAGLMFSPRYDQLKAADDALLKAYGISDDLLPFFNRKLNEETGVVTYYGMEDLQSVTGNYIVSITGGKAKVAWTLDGMEGGWNAEKLAEINTLCKEEGGYATAVLMAREDAEKHQLSGMDDSVFLAEKDFLAMQEQQNRDREIVKQAAKKATAEMDQTARAAIKERFGLTDDQLSMMKLEKDSCEWYIKNDRKLYSLYYWLWQSETGWMEGNGVYIVDVNVETGAVEEIFYDNGLLGNG